VIAFEAGDTTADKADETVQGKARTKIVNGYIKIGLNNALKGPNHQCL
jgi:hypothetical protein